MDTTLVGGAGNDTFTAVDTQVATTQTLTSGDSISGGAGTDTLTIAASGGAAVAAPLVASTGVEVINVTNNNTGLYTVDTSLMTGLTTVSATAGAADVTFSGQTKVLNAELISTNRDVTLSPASGTSGTADAMSVVLNGAGVSRSNTLTANGIETMNVTSTGSASGNSTNSTRVTLASDALDVVNVTGAANARLTVNFAGASGLDVATLNASGTTGGVNASLTLGASGKASVVGGTGNDGFTFAAALTKDVTVSGGDGTDTITVAGAVYSATATTQTAANVSGFEVLSISNAGSADVRAFSGNTGFTSYEAAGASATLAGLSTAAATITAKAIGGTVAVTRATDAASGDTLTVKLAATTPGTFTAVSVADEEVLTIESAGTAVGKNTITTLTATDATSLTVTGSNELDITTLAGATNLATLNAGGHTGSTFTINASNSSVAMTVTGSAGVNATDGATVNTITTGTGADSITGGAYRDVLTGGIGNDTIIGAGGNDSLYGNANNDYIDGGDGNDYIDGDVGNDSLVGGAGNDTILASTGNDTVSGGDGNDAIYVTSLSDEDSIDGGAGTADTLSASAPTLTGAGPTAAQYTDVSDSVASKITGVETGYIQVTTTGTNTAASTALTLDMTNVSGMSTLWLDLADGNVGGAAGDEHISVKNFSGSTVNLTELTGGTHSPEALTIDGTGQAAVTVNLRSYDVVAATSETTAFTGIESVTISGTSVINSAKVTNSLGTVTAASATNIGLSTSGSLATDPNTGALTVDSITAANAQTVRLNAGNYDTLAVTTDVSAANGLVQTLDIDVGTASTLNIDGGNIILTGSSLQTSTIDVLANGTLTEASGVTNVNLQATQIASLTANLGANSTTRLDIESGVTSGTVTMSSGSVFFADVIGKAGRDTSITFTGTGDVDKTAAGVTNITLLGATASLNFGGLTDSDGVSIISNASVAGTVTGTAFADEISGGAGNDSLSGGSGADRLGTIGRTETITISGVSATTDTFNATINGVTTLTSVTAAGSDASAATGLAEAINATTATSFATAAAVGAVITVTYQQYFGTTATTAIVVDAGGGAANAAAVLVTAVGDNAGADSLVGGEGADTIVGGTGNDTITLTETTAAADVVVLNAAATNGVDTIAGFAAGTGADVLSVVGADTTATTAAGNNAVFATGAITQLTAAGAFSIAALSNTATDDVLELTGGNTTTADLSAATDGTELFKLLGTAGNAATSLTIDNNGDKLYLVAYDGGNAYVYHILGDTSVEASDITLVAVLTGITAGDVASGDLIINGG